jgi:hypothetical protein
MNIMDVMDQSINHRGIPEIDIDVWDELCAKYSKREIVDGFAEFIADTKPSFPFRPISLLEVKNKLVSLKTENCYNFITSHTPNEVVEKYNDYKYPYSKHGKFVIEFGHYYNDISNYFQQENRMSCPSYGFKSPIDIWNSLELLKKMNWIFWRMGTNTINETNIRGSFRLGSYVATQFKPHVAKTLYDFFSAKTVLDFSMGWGDRLAGFYASSAERFYGVDPNPNTYRVYKQQCIEYEQMLGNTPTIEEIPDGFICRGSKEVIVRNIPAENSEWWPPAGSVDLVFTSPPYFSTEMYNMGGEKEENQSWRKYPEYENWYNNFLKTVCQKAFDTLSENGVMLINIMDPTINRIRHRTCDSLVDDFKEYFLGQIGMRIKQRPKKMEKNDLKEHLSSCFIENIWCFGKNKNMTIDLPYNGATLENFME